MSAGRNLCVWEVPLHLRNHLLAGGLESLRTFRKCTLFLMSPKAFNTNSLEQKFTSLLLQRYLMTWETPIFAPASPKKCPFLFVLCYTLSSYKSYAYLISKKIMMHKSADPLFLSPFLLFSRQSASQKINNIDRTVTIIDRLASRWRFHAVFGGERTLQWV